MASIDVDDGRLIRERKQGRPEDVSEEEQKYWNNVGWRRASIYCQVCGCSAESGFDHMGIGELAHNFKAKVPGVRYD